MAAAITYRTVFALVPVLIVSLVVLRFFLGTEAISDGLDALLKSSSDIVRPLAGRVRRRGRPRDRRRRGSRTIVDARRGHQLRRHRRRRRASCSFTPPFRCSSRSKRASTSSTPPPPGARSPPASPPTGRCSPSGPLGIIGVAHPRQTPIGRRARTPRLVSPPANRRRGPRCRHLVAHPPRRVPAHPEHQGQAAPRRASVRSSPPSCGNSPSRAFHSYLGFSTGYAALYGSLGLVPVFFLWVFVTWLIVLLGLEVSTLAPDPQRPPPQRFPARRTARPTPPARWPCSSALQGGSAQSRHDDASPTPPRPPTSPAERRSPSSDALVDASYLHKRGHAEQDESCVRAGTVRSRGDRADQTSRARSTPDHARSYPRAAHPPRTLRRTSPSTPSLRKAGLEQPSP